jgi:hypothetical protein
MSAFFQKIYDTPKELIAATHEFYSRSAIRLPLPKPDHMTPWINLRSNESVYPPALIVRARFLPINTNRPVRGGGDYERWKVLPAGKPSLMPFDSSGLKVLEGYKSTVGSILLKAVWAQGRGVRWDDKSSNPQDARFG